MPSRKPLAFVALRLAVAGCSQPAKQGSTPAAGAFPVGLVFDIGGRVVVGGAEIYEARCRRCFDLGRRARPVAESNGDLDGPPKSARVRRPHPARRRV